MNANKYPGSCHYCSGKVARNAGKCWKPAGARRFAVAHLACSDAKAPRVIETVFSSGAVVHQNYNGRCEDAPCCGCCS